MGTLWTQKERRRRLDILISVLSTNVRKLNPGNNSIKINILERPGATNRSGWAIVFWDRVWVCSNIHPGEKLLQVSHKDLSLLLDELLTAELKVSVDILLRVNVVFLYFRCPLGATETKGFSSSGISLQARCYQSVERVNCRFNKIVIGKKKKHYLQQEFKDGIVTVKSEEFGNSLRVQDFESSIYTQKERLNVRWCRIRVPPSVRHGKWPWVRRGR